MSAVLSRSNVYEAVTAQIVAAIEAGAGRCVMPWHAGVVPMMMPRNAVTEMPYHGVNVVALWAAASTHRYVTGYWASYKQWQALGANVRRGERGSLIIFYKRLDADPSKQEGEDQDTRRFVIRSSHVFNAEQVEGWGLPQPRRQSEVETNAQIEAFVAATKADIRHGSAIACYRRKPDYIDMPWREAFRGTPTSSPTEAYYAVLLHELTHWSGAPHRIDRTFGKRFGDADYAFEELVAELGAAFLCSAFGIVNEPRPDHAAYIAHWLEILGKDNRAIFTAAGMAQEAVEYLRSLAAEQGK
ncbi:MAG TPA: zincin-like metallopeptidase domain-containing protein [Rhizomicrobium sp.]